LGGIDLEAKRFADRETGDDQDFDWEFDTLYLGGGTPSLLLPGELSRLREILAEHLRISPVEFSLEANPSENIEVETFRGWLRSGVTRLSVGVQSFDDGVLATLGRDSTAARAESFFHQAREAGFSSLGLDLMIGVPGETPVSLDRTLDIVGKLRPDHVSLYLLENLEGLPFEEVWRVNPVDDDSAVEAFERAAAAIESLGLGRYEISNFSRPGHEGLHNLKYWRYEPVLGLGPSASSHLGLRRWTNASSVEEWLKALAEGRDPRAEDVILDREDSVREALVSGLRLVGGIDLESFSSRFDFDLLDRFGRKIAILESEGAIIRSGGVLRIPEDKLLISNSILSRLI